VSKLIYLTQGRVSIVDDEDYEELSKYNWHFCHGYASRRITINRKRTSLLMHRQIMNATKGQELDHINGDRSDNRKSNLRFVTRQQNAFNQKSSKNSSSQYRGVSIIRKYNKWISKIRVNNKLIYLGKFNTEEEAANVYNIKAKEVYGEYARLNEVQ